MRASEQATERNENVSGVEVRRSKQTKYEKTLPLYFFPLSLSFPRFRSSDFTFVFLLMTNEEEDDVVKWKSTVRVEK